MSLYINPATQLRLGNSNMSISHKQTKPSQLLGIGVPGSPRDKILQSYQKHINPSEEKI